jgi:hypothetical protein
MRRLRFLILILALSAAAVPADASSSSPVWNFVSAPRLHPPELEVLVRRPGLARGYFMLGDLPTPAFKGESALGGPELVDSRARPVWFDPGAGQAFDLQQQTYRGKPVLVWFQSPLGPERDVRPQRQPIGPGEVEIMDEHYRHVATIQARSPWMTDLHDASIVGGDIWITVIRLVRHQNLSRYGGPRDGSVTDVGLQEFQISTGRLVRTWDALNPGHRPNVPLSASHDRASQGWDAYHLDSVQALPNGDLLVSMRNTWSLYLVNPVRNRILWTLGGRASTFHVSQVAHFAWQHDAQLVHPGDDGRGRNVELTLFDDNTSRGPARGVILRLNTISHRASLVAAYPHHPSYYAQFLGSMQLLPSGNTLVDWGSPDAYFTEFSAAGKELLNVTWPLGQQSYRTLLTDRWVGTPYYPPSGAVRGETVYASWNGATEVSRWDVLAGSSASTLSVVASQARDGFETALKLSQTYRVYEVRALDAAGKVLGTSRSF